MDTFRQRDLLGTMKGLADFQRFRETFNQIERDEVILMELISRFIAKPRNQLLPKIDQISSYLKAEALGFRKMMRTNDIDGVIFCCVDQDSRVESLLRKVGEILGKYGGNL